MKYITICDADIRVPIISTDHDYKIVFGRYTMEFTPYMEALLIFEHFNPNSDGYLSEYLNYCYSHIKNSEIEDFIGVFEKDHSPSRAVYDRKNIDMLADDSHDFLMCVRELSAPVALSVGNERVLLDIIKSDGIDYWKALLDWWGNYCSTNGIKARYKFNYGNEPVLLAEAFCKIHGLSPGMLKLCTDICNDNKDRGPWGNFVYNLKFYLLVVLYFGLIIGGMVFGYYSDRPVSGPVIMIMCFLLLIVSLREMFKMR